MLKFPVCGFVGCFWGRLHAHARVSTSHVRGARVAHHQSMAMLVAMLSGAFVGPLPARHYAGATQVRMQSGALPLRNAPNPDKPEVIVTGGALGNVVYGKLQRAAQLPGARLGTNPYAAVGDRGKLNSILWGQFAMASVPSGWWLDREGLLGSYVLAGALLFVDATSDAGGGGGGGLPNPFESLFGGKKKPGGAAAAGSLDTEMLKYAAARGASHVYVLVEGDDAKVSEAVAACREAIDGLEGSDVSTCMTVIAPVDGTAIVATKGWVQQTTAQDHEGILSSPLGTRVGYTEAGGVEPTAGDATRTLSLSLGGCAAGIGIGIDTSGYVDLITPNKAAARGGILLGDRLIQWDDTPVLETVGGESQARLLKDVVTPGAETCTVVVERGSGGGAPGGPVPLEDFSELVVQSALRLSRVGSEGAPPVRVMRVNAASGGSLEERQLFESTYEGRFAGPKTRKRMGSVKSADWSVVLEQFGVVRVVDPNDNRVLMDAKKESVKGSPA